MSVSIDLHIYNKDDLMKELRGWGAVDTALATKILQACGTFFGDSYVLLNNEYYGGNSPYYNVASLFDAAFHKEDSFDVFLDHGNRYSTEGINYVDKDEVAEQLGIDLTDEDADASDD